MFSIVPSEAIPSDSFPYTATVSSSQGSVRCGPGLDYYATDELPAGTQVEVYRHDPDGWLAIRPPDGSFSWIDRDKLELQGNQLANVLTSDAVAWVGTRIGRVAHHKWQVELERGETVEVIGERSMALHSDIGRVPLIQVAPPSGEFRWIHASDIERGGARPRSDQIRLVGHETQATTADPQGLQSRLKRFNVALSKIVAEDIARWNFDGLRDEISQVDTLTTTTLARNRLDTLIDSIQQFEDLRERHERLNQASSAAPISDQREVAVGTGVSSELTPPVEDGGVGFAGEGWLMPVHSTRFTAPPFALLDDHGKVKYYVSPAPGFNLHRYKKKRVGVMGQSAYTQRLKANHLTAERVVVLR